ncbi:hypothetical protein N7G274_003136 [Stereocaulon virgatum]|uniref:Uncharacterized protein n=1 Tax=Stereocaulon virgatum TaxID=373712 RepID=A0ABR4AHY1_9LECA
MQPRQAAADNASMRVKHSWYYLHEAKCVQEVEEQGVYPKRQSRPETVLIGAGASLITGDCGLTMQVRSACLSVHVRREDAKRKRKVGFALDAEDPLPLAENFSRRGQQARLSSFRGPFRGVSGMSSGGRVPGATSVEAPDAPVKNQK